MAQAEIAFGDFWFALARLCGAQISPGAEKCSCWGWILAVDLNHPVHENARRHDGFRIEFAKFYEVPRLHDGEICCHRHYRIKVPSCSPVGEIAPAVGAPSLDERHIGPQCPFHDVSTAIEIARFLAFGEFGAS